MTPHRLSSFLDTANNLDGDGDINVDQAIMEEYAAGVASTVYKAIVKGRTIAVKSAASKKKFSPEPHDIVKEIALLQYLREKSHRNIVEYLGSRTSSVSIELWTSWCPYGLEDLLDGPRFTVSPVPSSIRHLFPFESDISEEGGPPWKDVFNIICKSVVFQTVSGLAHLHALDPPIGLRDVKPKNLLLKEDGTVKIIDFGIAYQQDISARSDNLWPEKKEKMYCDVATGPFRAPELLFGATTYDACAADLWSLGCTISHFFTPLRLFHRSHSSEDEDNEDENTKWREELTPNPFLLPGAPDKIDIQSAEWVRESLFDGTIGSIGLAWSTFRLRGTPNTKNWPNFHLLPDATKLEFSQVPPMDLRARFPNLPAGVGSTGSEHQPPNSMTPTPLDLIHRLLVYPPEARMTAMEALTHPWFISEAEGDLSTSVPVLLPKAPQGRAISFIGGTKGAAREITEWNNKSLGHWLSLAFKRG